MHNNYYNPGIKLPDFIDDAALVGEIIAPEIDMLLALKRKGVLPAYVPNLDVYASTDRRERPDNRASGMNWLKLPSGRY